MSSCLLHSAGLKLHAGGWESSYSSALKAGLRNLDGAILSIAVEFLAEIILGVAGARGQVFVPVPTSGRPQTSEDGLSRALRAACELVGSTSLPLLRRHRRLSTRASVAQVRKRIASSEYRIAVDPVQLAGQQIVLVDDTVTTGATLAGIAELIRYAGAEVSCAVTIDRTISPRLRQHLTCAYPLGCGHRSPLPI